VKNKRNLAVLLQRWVNVLVGLNVLKDRCHLAIVGFDEWGISFV
jgi:hypothetical protein